MECNEAIYNPLCHVCLAGEIKQWLNEQKNKEVAKSLNAELINLVKSFQGLDKPNIENIKCVACSKNTTILCPYCFTEIVYKKLKSLTKSKKMQADFLSLFNFDFEHTGYSKDAEKLGII